MRAKLWLRHGVIVFLCLGLVASNLRSGPVDAALEPVFGKTIQRLGIRQFWSMFAPNPVHNAMFVEAIAREPGGERPLHIGTEPPGEGFYFTWTYDRIGKFHKKVALKPERWLTPYGEALCRLHAVDGSVVLGAVRHKTPRPWKRRQGENKTRIEVPLGEVPCP
jgi:hypothetical protein